LPDQWKESIIVPIYKQSSKTDSVIIVECHWYQLHNSIHYPSLKVKFIYRSNFLG
jgi:hypothetical protein